MKKPYELVFMGQAIKDFKVLSPKIKLKLQDILSNVIAIEPQKGKKLLGPLAGNFSYRLNLKDRIVYSIDEKAKKVYIKRTKTHYGN